MKMSERQMEAFRFHERTHRIEIWSGAVSAGKTHCLLRGFIRWMGENFRGHQFLVAGRTVNLIERNLLPKIEDACREAGLGFKHERTKKGAIVGTNQILLHDAHNETSRARIQGLTVAGAYLDEAALMPRSFVDETIARCRIPGARILMSANPEGPEHWLKREFIDRASDPGLDIHCGVMTIFDNPSLDESYIRDVSASVSGPFLRRRVHGEWAAAIGQVFKFWKTEPRPSGAPAFMELAVDHATSSVTHAVLVGTWIIQGLPLSWAMGEWRHDAATGREMADAEQVAAIVARLCTPAQVRSVVCDPAAQGMQAALRRVFPRVVPAQNKLLEGIQLTDWLLTSGRLRIDPSCRWLLSEMASYEWDEIAASRGEDLPVFRNDHGVDALRYWSATLFAAGQQRPRLEIVG